MSQRFGETLRKARYQRNESEASRFDVSELQRAYGELKSTGEDTQSTEQSNGKAMTGHDRAEILAMKDNQIADLKAQLEKAEMRETALIAEKSKLLDITDRLQKQNETLMLPPPETKRNWLLRLIGAR